MHKICTNYQEPMCTPLGLDCYKGVRTEKAKCLKPCRGLYADMEKDNKLKSLGTIPNFASAYSSYESYKRGFQEDVNYRTVPSYKPLKPTLHWIRIYFSSPTFDRVTRDEKANFVTKLSAVGGTMGLFAGFSIISGIELLYFAFNRLYCFIVNNLRK